MPLRSCRDCGKAISTSANVCPHCGADCKIYTRDSGILDIIPGVASLSYQAKTVIMAVFLVLLFSSCIWLALLLK
jgi:RNA polymerase subunit RPABC4/transcription elongation factor Spt4